MPELLSRRAARPLLATLVMLTVLTTIGVASPTAADEACTTDASTTEQIVRIAGPDRWSTSACAARFGFPDGTSHVVIARGDDAGGFADALAGTVLATATDAPVVLVAQDRLPAVTEDALRDLGVRTATILGGTTAVGPRVEERLRALGIEVERLAGSDRADTAARIAARVAPNADRAVVVNGWRPADALVAGAVAARMNAPLLVVSKTTIPQPTAEALASSDEIYVIGGHGVIGAEVADVLGRTATLRRVAGGTRAETAASVARTFPASGAVHLVSGRDRNLADAIAASWLAARPGGGAVLYSDPDRPSQGTDRFLRLGGLRPDATVRLLGGTAVLTETLVDTLESRFDETRRGGPPAQMRAMWIHAFDSSLKSRAGIDAVLDAATSANLNTVIVQVARRHDAYYDSDVLPRSPDPQLPADLDVLAAVIDGARQRDLDVHAWFAIMPTDHKAYENLRMPSNHVRVLHGRDSGDSWLTEQNVARYEYLEPGIGPVQDHITAMVREVVERYDVDAVHLDYIRYPFPEAGFHPTSVDRFQRLGDGDFDAWRRQQVTELVRRIRLEVAEADPQVLVSLAAIAQGDGPGGPGVGSFRDTIAYGNKFQDWAAWIDEGLVDVVYPMAYFDEARYASRFDNWTRFAGTLTGRDAIVAIGQADYLNTIGSSLGQIAEAVDHTDGIALYSYQSEAAPGSGRGPLLDALANGEFADPAPVPEATWRTNPTRGAVIVEATDGQTVELRSTAGARNRRADAAGTAGFLQVEPGSWVVTVGGRSTTITVEAGRVTRVAREG